ncbi:hypothetical protein [Mucilaginibacter sp.]|uniref:hypothetical protein n=1 Tax=Mucilaginibacter sp. TaxID=1882438 RepID=UPI00261156B6|nr:hypothetical protein [Mucilaginibacter sp.]MDB4924355.1 peptide chain release factor 1 [Mucilaginibacter sp.]
MTPTSIESILEQLNLIEKKINTRDSLVIRGQILLLERIVSRFFEKSSYIDYIDDADESNEEIIEAGGEIEGHTYKHIRNILHMVIENLAIELTSFGFESKNDPKIDKSININNQHTINQSQSISVEFLKEIFKDSLTGKQLKELSEIVKEEKDVNKATSKLFDKIKGFGSDVASNIVAGILTNPHLYTSLF